MRQDGGLSLRSEPALRFRENWQYWKGVLMMVAVLYVAIGLAFVAIFTREVIAPASKAQCDNRWLLMAGAVNLTQMCAAIAAGYLFQSLLADKAAR